MNIKFISRYLEVFRKVLSNRRTAILLTLVAVAVPACGGGSSQESQEWEQRFETTLHNVIKLTTSLDKKVRPATGLSGIQGPYMEYAKNLEPFERELKTLGDSAPGPCAIVAKHAINFVSWRGSASQGIADPKNYTPAELENAKADPSESVARLKGFIREARC
jgi:hypothetical protein